MARTKPPRAWKPGQSGNPAGRKPGTGEVAKLRAAIAEHVPAIIERLTEAARSGDVAAARLLLERVIAPLKSHEAPVSISLPDGTLAEQGRAIVASVATAALSPGQGAALLTSLGSLAKLIETDELERRIEALEAAQPRGGASR